MIKMRPKEKTGASARTSVRVRKVTLKVYCGFASLTYNKLEFLPVDLDA